jgi:16S rRNA processing protein RimM
MQHSPDSSPHLIKLGVIIAAHGIQGLLKIKSFTNNPADLNKYGELYNYDQSQKFRIKITSCQNTTLLARINNIQDRSTAEKLIGTELYIKKDALPNLSENEYYHCDLIGMKVYDQDDQFYGQVIAVHNFGAGDIIEIQFNNSNKKVMYSFKHDIFPSIDLTHKIIIIKIS